MAKPLTLSEARASVLAAAKPVVAAETVDLSLALGRYLAESVSTDGPWPATDRSAMDGYAVCAGAGIAAGASLPVIGESLAGCPYGGDVPHGKAVRIMTGAVVPGGADTVVPVEATSGFSSSSVTFHQAVVAGQNIRRLGSEMPAGTEVLAPGRRLDAAAIGVLAVLGRAQVKVARRPRVAIVATGDEVVDVTRVPLPHQVRESNSHALAAQVAECGAEARRHGVAPDEATALRRILQHALADADVVLTIGGVSKGTHDLVHGTLQELGVQQQFHGIDLKPGKPTFFGVRDRDGARQYVFGLPGNPASSFTVFDLLVRPLLVRLSGGDPGDWRAVAAPAGARWSTNARLQAIPARLGGDDRGVGVSLAAPSPSGDPFSLLQGDVYVLVPPHRAPDDNAALTIVGRSGGVHLP